MNDSLNTIKATTTPKNSPDQGQNSIEYTYKVLEFFEALGLAAEAAHDDPSAVAKILGPLDCLAAQVLEGKTYTAFCFLRASVLIQCCNDMQVCNRYETLEKDVSAKLAKALNGKREVKCLLGSVDVMTETEIIEVKRASMWRHAVRQILGYSKEFKGKSMRIHLFGSPEVDRTPIAKACARRKIRLTEEAK